ncbi:MAG: hypothetical protein Q8K45_15210 [Rubrivivax sp.]|nr:hypothetical protein [Rubrivivax sp.]
MNLAPRPDLQEAPHVARLQTLFDQKHPFSPAWIGRALGALGSEWAADFEDALAPCAPTMTLSKLPARPTSMSST